MTVYARTVAVIVFAAVAIIIAGLTVGTQFLARHIRDAIKNDMMIVVDMADKYVANEIVLLKMHAAGAAKELSLARNFLDTIAELLLHSKFKVIASAVDEMLMTL